MVLGEKVSVSLHQKSVNLYMLYLFLQSTVHMNKVWLILAANA